MPELPEVETTRRGITPHVVGIRVTDVIIRDRRLRWPIPRELPRALRGATFDNIERRAKYLLFRTGAGCMLLHLGMSGSLRVVEDAAPVETHDHVDFVLASGRRLRFRDPRRFGSILWTTRDPMRHKLLVGLGPEPLGADLGGEYLHRRSRGRVQAVKNFIMDGRIVVGVGNIYANEALFEAEIRPARAAGKVSAESYERLAESIRDVLNRAIKHGGTTLRDFVSGVGEPGYFGQELKVYERTGENCLRCGGTVRTRRLGQRSSFYCPRCQK